MHAVGPIVAALDFALGVPARVVAEDGDEGQGAPHRGFEFGEVKADGAVAEHRENGRTGLDETRREREGQRAADGAGDAVDEAAAHRQHALAPLGEFAAVADRGRCQDRVRRTVARRETLPPDAGVRRSATRCVRQAAGRSSSAGARFGEPRRIARAHVRCRSGELRAAKPRSATRRARAGSPFSRRRARTRSLLRIDGDDADCGIESGAAAHLMVKSSALPSSTTRSACLRHRAKRAERRVCNAARAFQDDGRRSGRGLELAPAARVRPRSDSLRAGKDDRTRRPASAARIFVARGVGERGAAAIGTAAQATSRRFQRSARRADRTAG